MITQFVNGSQANLHCSNFGLNQTVSNGTVSNRIPGNSISIIINHVYTVSYASKQAISGHCWYIGIKPLQYKVRLYYKDKTLDKTRSSELAMEWYRPILRFVID